MYTVNFNDAQLQKCYANSLEEAIDAPGDLRPIGALIATCNLFRMLEGPHSARVHETLDQIVSAGLRPALRSWYQCSAPDMNSVAVEFRKQLNKLTGERLEIPGGHSANAS